jgi:uncharacterized membrane protein YdfJ with MMPL/SSD domain
VTDRSFTERLARAASRRRRLTIGIWLGVIVVALVSIPLLLPSALETTFKATNDPESTRAHDLIVSRLPGRSGVDVAVIVKSRTLQATEPSFQSAVRSLERRIRRQEGVARVTDPYAAEDPTLTSRDGHAVLVPVAMSGTEADAEKHIKKVVDVVTATDGDDPQAYITGQPVTGNDINTLSQHDLKKGELGFGLPAALVILLLVFGAFVAAFVPIVLAICSIVIAIGLVGVIGQATHFSIFVVNMITGMGLALGIDYTLFVLSRYREERARGLVKDEAIAASGATASRAVFFSGTAYVIALGGMLLTPLSVLRSLAAGAILVGVIALIAALTLLPAVLSLLGDRVDSLRLPFVKRAAAEGAEGGFWSWVSRWVMRHSAISLVAVVVLLLAAAAPIFGFHIGRGGLSTLPNSYPSKEGFVLLRSDFPAATASPVQVAVEGDVASQRVDGAIDRLAATLDRTPPFRQARVERAPDRDFALVTAVLAADPDGSRATGAVRHLRSEIVPRVFEDVDSKTLVGGATAENVDYFDTTRTWLPRVIAIVLALSFVLLTVAFRSVVLALKAILLNLLSVGAAYGLLVLVFQEGVGAGLLGFQQVDSIEAWVPLFLFSVLFGLSMDYHVFLLSRIRERFTLTGDNSDAVAYGISSTARLITGAAFIIIAVFVGFALGDLVMFQQMGFGVAVALLLDATVIRTVLVPASMHLLGKWNWYLPSWLSWLPDVGVEGKAPPRRAGAASA